MQHHKSAEFNKNLLLLFFLFRFFFLLFLNSGDVLFDLVNFQHFHWLSTSHNRQFQVLTSRLYHFQQCTNSKFDNLFFIFHFIDVVVFLQKLPNCFRITACCICLKVDIMLKIVTMKMNWILLDSPSIHGMFQKGLFDINGEYHQNQSQQANKKSQKDVFHYSVCIFVSSLKIFMNLKNPENLSFSKVININPAKAWHLCITEQLHYNDLWKIPAMYLVMYSRVTGSSTVSLWDWHSILALLIKIRASAVNPAKAITTWSSRRQILRTVLSSCSLATDFFSTPKITKFLPLTPTLKFKHVSQLLKYLQNMTTNIINIYLQQLILFWQLLEHIRLEKDDRLVKIL